MAANKKHNTLGEKYCGCIKKVRKTIKPRSGKTVRDKEGAAIAICTKSVLQTRGRTIRKFTCKNGKPNVKTQPMK